MFKQTTALAVLTLAAAPAMADVAITEFMINPYGGDADAPEYYELFNYGADTVDVTGWTLRDNSSGAFTFPEFSIPSGGYAVVANNLENFSTKWLAGGSDPRVVPVASGFQINNSSPGDGLILSDDEGNVEWSLGYSIGGDAGNAAAYRATFLAVDDFSVTNYGAPPQLATDAPLIVRNGLDGTGTLGYEDNDVTVDPFAYGSSARGADNVDTLDIDESLIEVEFGSPLLGNYTAATAVPEPAGLAVIGLGGLAFLRRRRA